MKIALLRTASDHIGLQSHGSLATIFSRFVAGIDTGGFDDFPLYEGVFPADDYKADIYLISGSKHSVHDNVPWINQLKTFVKERLSRDSGEKFVGFCFGHQMLAHVLGADVYRPENRAMPWNVGVKPMVMREQPDWMAPAKTAIEIGFMHQEHAALPRGATLLAGTQDCPNQMFEKGGRVLGIQGHPEYAPERIVHAMGIVGLGQEFQDATLTRAEASRDGSKIVQQWIHCFMHRAAQMAPVI